MKKKIIILDFATTEVYVLTYDENIWESGEDFIADNEHHQLDIKEGDCQWMIADALNINIIN